MSDFQLFVVIFISMLIMVILAVGMLVLYNVSRSRIIRHVQEAHAKEIAHKNDMLANTVEVQERERSRIAKDLHDDIGSKLSIVNLNLNLLRSKINDDDQSSQIVTQIETSLTDSISRAREISHNLYPPILEKFGIKSAMESLAKEVSRSGALQVHLDIDHPWREYDRASELHIYRIFQELLHNTIKHAEASCVWVKSQTEGKDHVFTYEDDGRGLPDEQPTAIGLGLSSIMTRISILGASMNIDRERSSGYHVEISIPTDNSV